jgi:hypothetical protein
MRTISFAVLIILTFIFLNASPVTTYRPTRYILFEHVGITDKPIYTVVIAQEKSHLPSALNSIYFKYFVNNALYIKSETIVINIKKSKQTQEFGNFKILIEAV